MDEWNSAYILLISLPSKYLYLVFSLSNWPPHLYQFYQPVDLIRLACPDNITFPLLLVMLLVSFFGKLVLAAQHETFIKASSLNKYGEMRLGK